MLINVATLTGSVGRPWERDMQAYLLAPSFKHQDRWMSLISITNRRGTGRPGASTAAAFVGSFVNENQPASSRYQGLMIKRGDANCPKGFFRLGVRSLDELLRQQEIILHVFIVLNACDEP